MKNVSEIFILRFSDFPISIWGGGYQENFILFVINYLIEGETQEQAPLAHSKPFIS